MEQELKVVKLKPGLEISTMSSDIFVRVCYCICIHYNDKSLEHFKFFNKEDFYNDRAILEAMIEAKQ